MLVLIRKILGWVELDVHVEIVSAWPDGSITRTNWGSVARDARRMAQTISRAACSRSAWSTIRITRSGQSCIAPKIAKPTLPLQQSSPRIIVARNAQRKGHSPTPGSAKAARRQ